MEDRDRAALTARIRAQYDRLPRRGRFGVFSGMSRRGYTTPYEDRPTPKPDDDETAVARREWEGLLEKFMIQAVRTGMAENHKGQMRDHEERAVLQNLRRQIALGVRRIERTFWRAAQQRAYLSMQSWVRTAGESGVVRVEDVDAEISRRLAALRATKKTETFI